MTTPTPQDYANWALEVNNAGLPGGSPRIAYHEAMTITQGAHEAFRQLVLELFILKDMTADDWFNDQVTRRGWATQIRMAYAEWAKDKT